MNLYNDFRAAIEHHKAAFDKTLMQEIAAYRRAVVRQLYNLNKYNKTPDDMRKLRDLFLRRFKYSPVLEKTVMFEFETAQKQIAATWNDFYKGQTGKVLTKEQYNKLIAAQAVDFGELEGDDRDRILKALKQAVNRGETFTELRARLVNSGLGNARTIANTALAQFDNAYNLESAQQAGVTKYRYDGSLHPNSRKFCKYHLYKQYTIKQIRALNNGQGLDVYTSLGGYNCTHFWTPVFDDLGRDDGDQTPPVPVKKDKKVARS